MSKNALRGSKIPSRPTGSRALKAADIPGLRLRAQALVGEPVASPVDAVRRLGAVQAQDYAAAKWALALRSRAETEASIDRLVDEGAVLRTHVMRPTWHFVAPEDIRWLQRLTSTRVLGGLAGRHRRLELDRATIQRATVIFERELTGGRHLTREELGRALAAEGISPEGQRLPHLLAVGEHNCLLVSGRRRGKQLTYALLEERVPPAPDLDPDEALRELTTRYFRSHGPAQLQDLAWWSGLTITQSRQGVELAGDALQRVTIDGSEYWLDAKADPARLPLVAHLLPNFDEYTVAYRDRGALVAPRTAFDPTVFSYYREETPLSGILSNVLTIGGRVRGAWRRELSPRRVRVEVRLLGALSPREARAVEAAAARFGDFLERPVDLAIVQP